MIYIGISIIIMITSIIFLKLDPNSIEYSIFLALCSIWFMTYSIALKLYKVKNNEQKNNNL